MFIKAGLQVGDKVRLKADVKVLSGTYTRGHIFTVESIGERGPDLIDEDGNKLLETLFVVDLLEKI